MYRSPFNRNVKACYLVSLCFSGESWCIWNERCTATCKLLFSCRWLLNDIIVKNIFRCWTKQSFLFPKSLPWRSLSPSSGLFFDFDFLGHLISFIQIWEIWIFVTLDLLVSYKAPVTLRRFGIVPVLMIKDLRNLGCIKYRVDLSVSVGMC